MRGAGDRRRSGLTLIEVLVAVAIVGTGFVVLLTGAARCLAVMKLARHYQTAQWVLGRGEAEFPLTATDDVEELEVSGEEYENGFTFSREIEEDEDEDELFVVRTRVTWTDSGHERYEETVRYILQQESE